MGNGSSKKAKRPGMPEDAPRQLKDFVACKRPDVEVDTSKLDWVPLGGALEFVSVGVKPGTAPNTGTVTIGMIEIPASVSSSGELVLDTSSQGLRLPIGKGRTLKDAIDNWVSEFNGWMAHNGKRLDGFTMKGTTVTLTKKPVAADDADTETEVGGGPGFTAPPAAEPAAEPAVAVGAPATEETPWYGTTLAKVVGTVTVIGAAFGIYFGVTAGNGDDTSTEVTAAQDTEQVEEAPQQDPEPRPPAETEPPPEPEPQPPPETEPEPEVTGEISFDPFEPFDADVFVVDFPDVGQAWNVADQENFGEIAVPGDPGAEIVIRPTIGGGANVIGFTDTITAGGFEVFSFGASGQNGFTVLFPNQPNQGFGVQGDFFINACPNGGSIFGGEIPERGDSTGASLYFDTDDPAFPPDTTGTAGFFFENPSTIPFGHELVTGAVTTDGSAITDEFLDCINDPSSARLLQGFFTGSTSGSPSAVRGASSPRDFLESSAAGLADMELFADGFESGDTSAWSTGGQGGVRDCTSGEALDSPGADLLAAGATVSGDRLRIFVPTLVSPTLIQESWSRATSAFLAGLDGSQREFINEWHDGEFQMGERDFSDGSIVPFDDGVIESFDGYFYFEVPVDPANLPAFVSVTAFETLDEGDPLACDQLIAPLDPFPVPTDPGRFTVEAPGFESGPASGSDGTLLTGPIGSVIVRPLNTCEAFDSYWIFVAGTSDVDYDITVTDTITGDVRQYTNPLDQPAAPIVDTSAFATCP